jgi:hypothetical protein
VYSRIATGMVVTVMKPQALIVTRQLWVAGQAKIQAIRSDCSAAASDVDDTRQFSDSAKTVLAPASTNRNPNIEVGIERILVIEPVGLCEMIAHMC